MMFKRPFARATQTGFTFCSRSYGHKRYDEMSELAYHMLELEIARTREDPRRVAPVLSGPYESVLDIGCGAGQTLITSNLKPTTFSCGVDIDQDALRHRQSDARGGFRSSASRARPIPRRDGVKTGLISADSLILEEFLPKSWQSYDLRY